MAKRIKRAGAGKTGAAKKTVSKRGKKKNFKVNTFDYVKKGGSKRGESLAQFKKFKKTGSRL